MAGKRGKKRVHGWGPAHFGHVYMVTCTETDLVYIGKTHLENPVWRWNQHLRDAEAGSNTKFHAAVRVHGVETFSFQPIACALKKEYLAQLELDLIAQYDADRSGLNTEGPTRWERKRSEMSAASSLLFKAMHRAGIPKVMETLNALIEQECSAHDSGSLSAG
jgi:hypothetical protein